MESVKNAAIPADRIRMVYEKGERFENRNKSLSKKDDAVSCYLIKFKKNDDRFHCKKDD